MIYRWMALSGLILAAWGGPEVVAPRIDDLQHQIELPPGQTLLAARPLITGGEVGEWDKKWDSWGGGKKGGWWN